MTKYNVEELLNRIYDEIFNYRLEHTRAYYGTELILAESPSYIILDFRILQALKEYNVAQLRLNYKAPDSKTRLFGVEVIEVDREDFIAIGDLRILC